MDHRTRPGPIRIGISGWTYPGWRGTFYPAALPQRAEMDYAASRFHSIEVNGSFYSLQKAAYFRSWFERCDDDFVFAIKGSRFITHMKQLNDPEQPLANFFAQGILELGAKLGPILWQFSPRFRFRPEKLEPFLALLPRTHAAAADLAGRHDHRVKDPATTALVPDRPIRYAIEIRHESFLVPDFIELLREHDAAVVVSGTAGAYPLVEEPTTDFMYLRLHGSEAMYAGSYPDPQLDAWADRIRAWADGDQPQDASTISDTAPDALPGATGRAIYVYFDNDQKTKAPFDARRLMERLDLATDFPRPGTEESMPA
ncbi:MAG: DUF72 domain-containing protein [Gemmatimonadetes bacterium]|nr:DUF72 domain-containing protein [Gemmatimonadota bacterium]